MEQLKQEVVRGELHHGRTGGMAETLIGPRDDAAKLFVGEGVAWADDRQATLMPCGSTTIISRHPLIIAPCVSYSTINERYAPRASLNTIRRASSFGCGVAYINDALTKAIRYSGTTSFANDRDKIANSGLHTSFRPMAPRLDDLPIHFECKLVGEIRMGTHIMFLGEVMSILVRSDLSVNNPVIWCPWADVKESAQ